MYLPTATTTVLVYVLKFDKIKIIYESYYMLSLQCVTLVPFSRVFKMRNCLFLFFLLVLHDQTLKTKMLDAVIVNHHMYVYVPSTLVSVILTGPTVLARHVH